jgi:phosphoribosylamine--glycine ligase
VNDAGRPLNILVVGGGGREHALCWKLARSPRAGRLLCAPGNPGTSAHAENVPVAADDLDGLLALARRERIDLTIVGPEEPLCAGIVDRFEAAGLKIFGPCADAAKLEGDKAYAKLLMRQAGVPTAEARVFGPTAQELAQARQAGRGEPSGRGYQTGYDMAREYIATRDEGVVVKACGLAKGKGVFVHADPSAALRTLEDLMIRRSLGEAGQRVVVEELLLGREVSVLALVDGRSLYLLETASDHKRLGENDTGPNTGGMGAYSPSDAITDEELAAIERTVLVPVVDALRREDVTYRGVLYAGMMMTAGGPKVLEFNCRFGDPETQPILMRLESDLVEALEATVEGRLDQIELRWDHRPAVCVVMASAGYPGAYERGKVIEGVNRAGRDADVCVFHAGTAEEGGRVVTAGGRVLGVTALGETMGTARRRAYDAVRSVSFEGAYWRSDIAAKAGGK